MSDDQKSALLTMTNEWEQIAEKCSAVAQRHLAKGEKLQYLEQKAYSVSRRACAEQLKRWVDSGEAKAT